MSKVNLKLKKFNMKMVDDDAVVVFICRRRTGKSFCVRDMFYHHRDIPFLTVISATEPANEFFGKFMPKSFIFDEYDENIVMNIIKRQQMLITKMQSDNKYKKIDPRVILTLDDCLFDSEWTKHKCIIQIFMNGRHYKMMFVVTMQYPLGIPPSLRTNIDYVFLMKEPYISNRKRIYENFAGVFPDFNVFNQVMNSLNQFECLVVATNSQSNKLEDQVFWYKANDHDNFKMGSPQFWKYHNENYSEDKSQTNAAFIDRYQKNKKKIKLEIEKI